MELRRALESDAQGIASVHVRSWQAAYRGIMPDSYLHAMSLQTRENVWQGMIARGDTEVWVAVTAAGVAGWISLGPSRDEGAASTTGELLAIYVDQPYWGKGIGRQLWFKGRSRLVERGFTAVTLWVLMENVRAVSFYRAAGFTPDCLSRRAIHRAGKELMEIRYAITFG